MANSQTRWIGEEREGSWWHVLSLSLQSVSAKYRDSSETLISTIIERWHILIFGLYCSFEYWTRHQVRRKRHFRIELAHHFISHGQTAGHSFFLTLGRISEGTTGNISSLFTDTLDDLWRFSGKLKYSVSPWVTAPQCPMHSYQKTNVHTDPNSIKVLISTETVHNSNI